MIKMNMTYEMSKKICDKIDLMFDDQERVRIVGGMSMSTLDRLAIQLKPFIEMIEMLDGEQDQTTIQVDHSFLVHINKLLAVSGDWK